MTTKERLIQMCVERGLLQEQAEQIVNDAIPEINKNVDGYRITWDLPESGYPSELYIQWFETVKINLKCGVENFLNNKGEYDAKDKNRMGKEPRRISRLFLECFHRLLAWL